MNMVMSFNITFGFKIYRVSYVVELIINIERMCAITACTRFGNRMCSNVTLPTVNAIHPNMSNILIPKKPKECIANFVTWAPGFACRFTWCAISSRFFRLCRTKMWTR